MRQTLQSVADCYYKVCQVLQNVTGCHYIVRQVLLKCDSYYKLRRNTVIAYKTKFSFRFIDNFLSC